MGGLGSNGSRKVQIGGGGSQFQTAFGRNLSGKRNENLSRGDGTDEGTTKNFPRFDSAFLARLNLFQGKRNGGDGGENGDNG